MQDLPKTYNYRETEAKIYKFWEKEGLFTADTSKKEKRFSIMMPPPNVTGILHMGHVLNNTLQDIISRWKRMEGYNVLWQPGTDHAGIATQNVVEKELQLEGKTRFDFTREGFIERVWRWKEKYGDIIITQLKKLGVSADWSRLRFTMDEGLTKAVAHSFVELYKKGLIYKGVRIINWCPRCATALADDEVEYKEQQGRLYYIKYRLEDAEEYITVATTRPESYLGDTAVAVHPDDKKYKKFIGKRVILPLVNWKRYSFSIEGRGRSVDNSIPVLASTLVDPEFGTGAVKVTPAHDATDFDIGEENGLPQVVVIGEDGKMTENAGFYSGLDRTEAREKIVKDLKEKGYILKIEDYIHNVGHCYRCDTVIEPLLSEQWFLSMKPLAEDAIKVVEDGKIEIIPDFWRKVYFHWLRNVRDWCISRQIWWGHRIPVYYCERCGEVNVSETRPESCISCTSSHLRQEEDVLDTWFSSWLWPFSTLGWPEKTKELEIFYPTDALISGWDILFFWVARMIMAGLFFTKKVPFKVVYLNGMVRDEQRRILSKSLGNSPDPLDLIGNFGADGVRMGILLITPEGRDVLFSPKKLESGRNFANKLWNAVRLIMQNSQGFEYKGLTDRLTIEDKWILTELNELISEVTEALNRFDFNHAAHQLYDFFWHSFCDWYLEIAKLRFYNTTDEKEDALSVAFYVLERFIKLLHPFMPFITEEIWQILPFNKENSIMLSSWPKSDSNVYREEKKAFQLLIKLIHEVREIRNIFKIPRTKSIRLFINTERENLIRDNEIIIKKLACISDVTMKVTQAKDAISFTVDGIEGYLDIGDNIIIEEERRRIEKEIATVRELIEKGEREINNPDFINKAPHRVVKKKKERIENLREKRSILERQLARLLS